jgi:DNA repair protein RecO (recombination protein O)
MAGAHPTFEEAYLLRSVPFRDNDAVVTLLTPSAGRISALARGARSSRKRFGAALDFFCLLRAELRPRRAGMAELLSVELVRSFGNIRGDIDRYLVGSHFLEVARLASREGDPAANPFRLLDAALGALEGGADPRSLLRIFQIRAVAEAGFALEGSACAFCGDPLGDGAAVSFREAAPACPVCAGASARPAGPGARKTLRAARLLPLDRLATLRVPPALEREIGPLVEDALVRALGEEPRSLASLRGAFPDAIPD